MNKGSPVQVLPNLVRYFAYTAFKGFGFGLITAMWLIYLQQRRGFTLTQATFIDLAFWIAAALSEIPTGILADTLGRKTSLTAGAALMTVSIFAWAYAPTMALIMIAYMGLAVGTTFLTGADDALFYESLHIAGYTDQYPRFVGRVGAVMLAATALGNVASGLLATINLILPFLTAGLSLLTMLGIVLTFHEPRLEDKPRGQTRNPYGRVLRESIGILRSRPSLRFPVLYLALVPLATTMMETFFLQPQAVALGVPIAAIGGVVMAVQIANIAGSTWSDRFRSWFGESRLFRVSPVVIITSLILLAVVQSLPGLLFIALIGFITAALRPLLLSRIQSEVPDSIRATLLSMQSLMFTFLLTISEPALGFMADHAGLSAAYVGLAGGLGVLVLLLFCTGRRPFLHGVS